MNLFNYPPGNYLVARSPQNEYVPSFRTKSSFHRDSQTPMGQFLGTSEKPNRYIVTEPKFPMSYQGSPLFTPRPENEANTPDSLHESTSASVSSFSSVQLKSEGPHKYLINKFKDLGEECDALMSINDALLNTNGCLLAVLNQKCLPGDLSSETFSQLVENLNKFNRNQSVISTNHIVMETILGNLQRLGKQ